MKHIILFGVGPLIFNLLLSCHGQTKTGSQTQEPSNTKKLVGGGCDGCEIMFVDMPTNISSVDTSAGWHVEGQKLLIKGKAYSIDGKTPAADVVIYYWQTDNRGYYSPTPGMNEKAKRHGHIRGWVKTDAAGNYGLYTIRPAPYPNNTMPAHIHLSIKEPNIANEYYIDEFTFNDDKFLTSEKRKALENRGGSGILTVTTTGSLQIAEHDIVLGLHIPDYPVRK